MYRSLTAILIVAQSTATSVWRLRLQRIAVVRMLVPGMSFQSGQ